MQCLDRRLGDAKVCDGSDDAVEADEDEHRIQKACCTRAGFDIADKVALDEDGKGRRDREVADSKQGLHLVF